MKVVILAGGFGTRISEESVNRPKPMVEIGDQPILWHIMKEYSQYGFNDFIICLGYKQYVIKEYFANYFLHTSDITIDLAHNSMELHDNYSEPWKVTLVDTGLNTMTGGRVKRMTNVGQRFGVIDYDDKGQIAAFREKSDKDGSMINIGYMVMEPGVFDYIDGDDQPLEREPFERLAADGQMMGYIHEGFWSCMDTLRDKNRLEALWESGKAPWKTWKD